MPKNVRKSSLSSKEDSEVNKIIETNSKPLPQIQEEDGEEEQPRSNRKLKKNRDRLNLNSDEEQDSPQQPIQPPIPPSADVENKR